MTSGGQAPQPGATEPLPGRLKVRKHHLALLQLLGGLFGFALLLFLVVLPRMPRSATRAPAGSARMPAERRGRWVCPRPGRAGLGARRARACSSLRRLAESSRGRRGGCMRRASSACQSRPSNQRCRRTSAALPASMPRRRAGLRSSSRATKSCAAVGGFPLHACQALPPAAWGTAHKCSESWVLQPQLGMLRVAQTRTLSPGESRCCAH
jgi:hypothetical protein